jgi:hypothetical protein
MSPVLPDWPVRSRAETLRQWPVLVGLVDRARRLPGFGCFILIGSFAGGRPDLVSDVDSILAIKDGSFEEAWSRRSELSTPDAAVVWDVPDESGREIGAHKWVSPELVLVECVFATLSSHARLADPLVVLAGDPTYVESFNRVEPITREQLEAYVEQSRREGRVQPEVQVRYDALVRAVRAQSV